MPERDYVADILTISYEGIFDFDNLYKTLHQWFKRHRYTFKESDYKEYRDRGQQHLSTLWQGSKKITDYVTYVMEVNIYLNNMTSLAVKGKKKIKGSLTIKIAAFLQKDYEETWSRKVWSKFIREVYDKFIAGSKLRELHDELLHEMNLLRAE